MNASAHISGNIDLNARQLLALLAPAFGECLQALNAGEREISELLESNDLPQPNLPAYAEAVRQVNRLRQDIESLIGLAELFDLDSPLMQERLLLPSLLQSVVDALRKARPRPWEIAIAAKEPAPVYASKQWLAAALHKLLGALDEHHPRQLSITLSLRQIGNHQLIVPNVGRKVHATAHYDRAGRDPQAAPLPGSTALTLRMCQRIVSLHGGNLQLQTEESESGVSLLSFTLSLPTGIDLQVPKCHAACPLRQQIESYATDLGALLDKLSKQKESVK
jgi:signal transduction histidine kinase